MPTDPIPLLQARGTHRDVGLQIGRQIKPTLHRLHERERQHLPTGVSWSDMVNQAQPYLEASRAAFPHYVEEIEGIARGAELPLEELFVGVCEELWSPVIWGRPVQGSPYGPVPSPRHGCTDMAARGRATVDGSTLLAHTNDLPPAAEDDLVILQLQAGDDPEVLGVSPGGLVFSAGFNAAGISLTGNEVSPNDVCPGVPRALIARAILSARRLEEALAACLHPQRASSYNNIVADAHGEVFSMEGSATDCQPIYIEGDILAHANHYVSPAMRRFELEPSDNAGSIYRHHRAWRLLRDNYGRHSPELFRQLLADHANYPGSICQHGPALATVFSLIIQLERRRAWIGRGQPCETTYYEYSLLP